MAVEFAIAHELGHALTLNDVPADDAANEAGAHRLGCVLLRLSASQRQFGWGEDILEDVTQAAVGIIFFRILLEARQTLTAGLLRRTSIAPGGCFDELDALERGRAEVARDLTREMLSAVQQAGCADDEKRLSALIDNSQAFLRDLDQTLSALPDAAITKALAIAASTVL